MPDRELSPYNLQLLIWREYLTVLHCMDGTCGTWYRRSGCFERVGMGTETRAVWVADW
jgi:hypothetical protein